MVFGVKHITCVLFNFFESIVSVCVDLNHQSHLFTHSIPSLFLTAFKTRRRRRRRRTLRKQEGSPSCSKEKASPPSSSPRGSPTTNSCSHAGTTSCPTTKRGNALWNWFYHCPGYGIRNGISNCPPCCWRCCQLIWWE